jgi:two-component system heavy metal sensor histidine kinase CusS
MRFRTAQPAQPPDAGPRDRSAVLVTVLVIGFNIFLRNQSHADLDRRLAERASAALSNVDARGGSLRVREAPNDQALDQQVWVFAPEQQPVERPAASAAADRVAADLARRPGGYRDVAGLDLRLDSVAIIHRGARVGTVVAGAPVGPYETTANHALVASIVLA